MRMNLDEKDTSRVLDEHDENMLAELQKAICNGVAETPNEKYKVVGYHVTARVLDWIAENYMDEDPHQVAEWMMGRIGNAGHGVDLQDLLENFIDRVDHDGLAGNVIAHLMSYCLDIEEAREVMKRVEDHEIKRLQKRAAIEAV